MNARTLNVAIMALVTIMSLTANLMAQGGMIGDAPKPKGGPWPGIIITIVLVGAWFYANVKKSGRGHQD